MSAGILMYKRTEAGLLVLLVHPGGPFWAKKDFGAWSIPKGEHEEGEDPLNVARREFADELGAAPEGTFHELGAVTQRSGKEVTAFAVEGDFAVEALRSNTFALEWPPRSGRTRHFPEVDRGAWFPIPETRCRILAGQSAFLDRLLARLGEPEPPRS